MQDWPIEVADGERVEEFLAHLETESRPDRRFAIVTLVVASLDTAFSSAPPPKSLLDRVAPLVREYPDLIEYWSCPAAQSDEEMFAITGWIRGL